jgi:hypothetical protein
MASIANKNNMVLCHNSTTTRRKTDFLLCSRITTFTSRNIDVVLRLTQPLQGVVVLVIVWQLDLQLPMQSVPITTEAVSSFESRTGRGVQHYVIKLASDLRQVGGFPRLPPPIKLLATM